MSASLNIIAVLKVNWPTELWSVSFFTYFGIPLIYFTLIKPSKIISLDIVNAKSKQLLSHVVGKALETLYEWKEWEINGSILVFQVSSAVAWHLLVQFTLQAS